MATRPRLTWEALVAIVGERKAMHLIRHHSGWGLPRAEAVLCQKRDARCAADWMQGKSPAELMAVYAMTKKQVRRVINAERRRRLMAKLAEREG